jgi:hypothetical protein
MALQSWLGTRENVFERSQGKRVNEGFQASVPDAIGTERALKSGRSAPSQHDRRPDGSIMRLAMAE